jgi:hypothetical protein
LIVKVLLRIQKQAMPQPLQKKIVQLPGHEAQNIIKTVIEVDLQRQEEDDPLFADGYDHQQIDDIVVALRSDETKCHPLIAIVVNHPYLNVKVEVNPDPLPDPGHVPGHL